MLQMAVCFGDMGVQTDLEYMKKRLIIHVTMVSTCTCRLGMAWRMLLIMFRPLMVPSVIP